LELDLAIQPFVISARLEAMKRILVVEDEALVRTLLYRHLVHQQYEVEAVETGSLAMSLVDQFDPELVILDVNLPDTNGLELCHLIRRKTNSLILFLTNSTDREDRLRGFSSGADDYVTKPFDLEELSMRIQALFRRTQLSQKVLKAPLVFNDLVIDPIQHEVRIDGNLVYFTALEFRLLHCMANQPGRAWTRAELLKEVWEYDCGGEDRVVDVHIGQIRQKIERDRNHPQFIHTVRGVGYKFEPPTHSNRE
jgi:two-component system, OmpR family, response regulator